MSNIAQFLISNQDGPPETDEDWEAEAREDYVNEPFLESEYIIPLLWFTLFSTDNIRTYIDPDDEIDLPYLTSPVSEAKARFEGRLPEMRKAFKNIDDYAPQWMKIINGIEKEFIKVQLYEILEMSEDGYDLLAPALQFFDKPDSDTMLALMRLTDFPNVFDQENGTFVDREADDVGTTQEYLFGFDPWK